MKYRHIYYLVSLTIIFFWSCQTLKVNQITTDKLYKKENNEVEAKYIIFHLNDSISKLFYEISNEHLIYKKKDTSNYFYCHVKLSLQTSKEDDLSRVIDTTTIVITDRQTDVLVKQLSGVIFFRLMSGSNYHVNMSVLDIHKKMNYTQSIYANKQNIQTHQNFLVKNTRNEVFFTSYYKPQEIINIESERNSEQLFNVDYFKTNFSIALPPFSIEQMPHYSYKPDSTFSIYKRDNKLELSLPQNGFFHLKTNDATKEGITFFVYETSYPKLKNTDQMILATRYIMAKKEFETCMNSYNKKVAIDKFWLDLGGSSERAKELIKKYYGRVQEANKTFTSFQEGWKTDRGMIYIVFGAPNKVTKFKNGEIWIYGETRNPNATIFSFIKALNPFTDNDYYLERREVFKTPWYQAVDMWRQGRIYLDN